jgi:hypothetical protein
MLRYPTKRANISLQKYSELLRIIKDCDGKCMHEIGASFAALWNSQINVTHAPHSELLWYYNHIDYLINSEKEVAPRHIIRIGNQHYGIEPDMQAIEWGAFEDLAALCKAPEQSDNLARIMAILYRPIKKVWFHKVYALDSYVNEKQVDFEKRVRTFDEALTMEEVQGAMAFFLSNQQP